MNVRSRLWLLLVAFVIHDGEEIATVPLWIANNKEVLEGIASMGSLPRWAVQNLSTSAFELMIAVGFELALILAATLLLVRRTEVGFPAYLYAAILGVFVLHALTHLAQALAYGGYTPGVISAVLIIPPTGMYLYGRLFAAGLLTPKTAAWSALAGVALIFPILMLAHYLGRIIA